MFEMSWPRSYINISRLAVCTKAISLGVRKLALRQNPHLILAIEDFYFEHLEEPLRLWLYEYLKNHAATKSMSQSEIMRALQGKTEVAADADDLLTLSREWLKHLLPFVLGKVNRVHYGLLRRKDRLDLTTRGYPPTGTRLQVAVPFTGLDDKGATS